MALDNLKELTPIIYSDSPVKILHLCVEPCGWCFRMHWHERMELLHITQGSIKVRIGAVEREAHAGDTVIIGPCVPHAGDAGSSGARYTVFMFEPAVFANRALFPGRTPELISERRCAFLPVVSDVPLAALLDRIDAVHPVTGDACRLERAGLVYQVLGVLIGRSAAAVPPGQERSSRLRNVIDRISRDFCQEITAASLSREYGYNEAYFCRSFKRETGLTLTEYIRILRLEKAQRLLSDTEMSIAAVCAECGFSEPGYFTRCFNSHFGMTPSEYRTLNTV